MIICRRLGANRFLCLVCAYPSGKVRQAAQTTFHHYFTNSICPESFIYNCTLILKGFYGVLRLILRIINILYTYKCILRGYSTHLKLVGKRYQILKQYFQVLMLDSACIFLISSLQRFRINCKIINIFLFQVGLQFRTFLHRKMERNQKSKSKFE